MMNSNLLMIVVAILLLASCKSNVNKTMNEVKEMVFMEEEEDEESNGEVINLNDYVDLGLPSGTHWKWKMKVISIIGIVPLTYLERNTYPMKNNGTN